MHTHKHLTVAWIDESRCVGCTKCLDVCPVDAIVGASQQAHTVILDDCIGCALCVSPCPVDCIVMQPITRDTPLDPTRVKKRLTAHRQRMMTTQNQQTQTYQTETQDDEKKRRYVEKLLQQRLKKATGKEVS